MTPLLTISEAAKILRMSTDTVRRYALAGKIPCRRLGRKTLFTESDLASYIESCRFEREGPAGANQGRLVAGKVKTIDQYLSLKREGKVVAGKLQSDEYYLRRRHKQ
jgi:excisionase family DNA binding protein